MKKLILLTIVLLTALVLVACEAEDSEDDEEQDRSSDDDDDDDDDGGDDDDASGTPPTLEEPTCPDKVYIGSDFSIQAGWEDPDGNVTTVWLTEYFGDYSDMDEIKASNAGIIAGRTFGIMSLERDDTAFALEGTHLFEVWLEDDESLTSEHVWCDILFENQPIK